MGPVRMERTLSALRSNPARAIAFALLVGYVVAATVAVTTHWYFGDASAYWNAALRIRAGEPLYFSVPADPANPAIYRYAPWFAYAWVPLTYLPRELVMVAWGSVLLAAAGYLLWPRRRTPAYFALSLLCFPDLLRVTSTGNVQPLLLAALAWRMTPWMIGLAASLKPWALAFAVVHWRSPWKIGAALGITALLWLPVVLATDYPPPVGGIPPGSLALALAGAARLARPAGSADGAPAQVASSLDPRRGRAWLPRAASAVLPARRTRG